MTRLSVNINKIANSETQEAAMFLMFSKLLLIAKDLVLKELQCIRPDDDISAIGCL